MQADPVASLEDFPHRWVASGEVTAVFAAIATPEQTVWSAGASSDATAPPTQTSLFDAASLTKPWMATLALCLDGSGELPLGTRVGEIWPRCPMPLAASSLADLLRHRSGLEPWAPLYRRCRSRASAERLLVSAALAGGGGRRRSSAARPAPSTARRPPTSPSASLPPRASRYSDLGYILWGFAAERRLGVALEALLRGALVRPLDTPGVEVSPGPRPDVVACRCDNATEVALAAAQGLRLARRGPPAPGEPQDGNARFLGGLAGHAGLFVSGEAMLALGREWLRAVGGGAALLSAATARQALAGRGEYALGWARRRVGGSAGPALSPDAFGHVGFTGTSLWIDPHRRTMFLLLAHRSGVESHLNAARRRFHTLAVTSLPGLERRIGGGRAAGPDARLSRGRDRRGRPGSTP